MLWFYFVALTESPMFSYIAVALVAYVAGCFSHKWAASRFKSLSGSDPQALADQAKAELGSFKS